MTNEHVSRREFAGRIAAAAAVPLITAGAMDWPAEAAQKPDDAKLPSPIERMLELIREQYPDRRLDDAGIAEIREELESQIVRSARLSAFPLTNADEPGFEFKAYRGEGKKIEGRR
ncbi:MAG TPA: hypothetical protein VL475_03845 [Planctomycetaceae bacterium]|jgi:hypothetical protein|nr:hypothetical protein [Planctomycetaceae bacterium]